MNSKVYGLVNPEGVIVNTFYWDHDPNTYEVEKGFSIVCIDGVPNCGMYWTYKNGVFKEPTLPPLEYTHPNLIIPDIKPVAPSPEQILARLNELQIEVAHLLTPKQ